ncbi:MAG: ATP-binding protein [Deltaproteobacteria bacterium]|nr:ATP-binding protein [Deltaproteobacteria bacterium]
MALPKGRSAFLWGPRKTGKTTFLEQLFPGALRYNLLETDTFFRLSKEPHKLREELLSPARRNPPGPIIVDEVQKVPALLDEVHLLIESKKLGFVLCGSSARKLKRAGANMLGGRAWRFEMYPFTFHELGKRFDLLQALNRGLLPPHYFDEDYPRTIKAYVGDYLKEEILQEGVLRNLPAFARFLDAVPYSNGEMVNYANIGRECFVDAKTVAGYFQILVDTLLGRFLEPFRKRKKRQNITATPKFYLFDVGVAAGLAKRVIQTNRGAEFGKAFEHLIFMELCAYRSYFEKDFDMSYWRTKDGHEVDFVLNGGEVAIEVKGSESVSPVDLTGLAAFKEEFPPRRSLVVSQDPAPRLLASGIEVLPWRKFLTDLWDGVIV